MKPFRFLILPLAMGLMVSCDIPGYGTIQENTKPITVHFSDVSLGFNLLSINLNKDISRDCQEICEAHNVPYTYGTFEYEIKQLSDILLLEDAFERNRKPSITLKISSPYHKDTTKFFVREEVPAEALSNIPNIYGADTYNLTISSIKTEENKLRVVWENRTSKFEDFTPLSITGAVKDENVDDQNIVEALWDPNAFSVIVKVDGCAARDNEIIHNTLGMDEDGNYYDYYDDSQVDMDDEEVVEFDEYEEEEAGPSYEDEFCEVDNPLVSPTLLRPIYFGGRFQDNLRWKIPVILARIN